MYGIGYYDKKRAIFSENMLMRYLIILREEKTDFMMMFCAVSTTKRLKFISAGAHSATQWNQTRLRSFAKRTRDTE